MMKKKPFSLHLISLFFSILMIASCRRVTSIKVHGLVLLNPPSTAEEVKDNFTDIPQYPGSRQVNVEHLPLPSKPSNEEWVRWEYGIYRTNDPLEVVVNFYKKSMKLEGWEGRWMTTKDVISGMFTKGDKTAAIISINNRSGITILMIVRTEKR
jgi:hypothetical protein